MGRFAIANARGFCGGKLIEPGERFLVPDYLGPASWYDFDVAEDGASAVEAVVPIASDVEELAPDNEAEESEHSTSRRGRKRAATE